MKRLLTVGDLHAIEILQQEVVAALEDPNILQPLSTDELLNILQGNGMMLGVFEQGQLIAFRALLRPEIDEEEHLGMDVGAHDLSRVLYQEISNVHPNYRGQGLQQKMAEWIMEHVGKADYDWVCATVMPYNIASLKDKFAQGMHVYALKLKYGGKLRYVFGKQLHESRTFTSEPVMVRMSDTVAQQRFIQEGYVGISMLAADEDWLVTYRK